jgi:hypothetical protein
VETTIDDDHRVTDFMAANETESVRNFLYEPSRAIVEVVTDEAYDYLAGTEDQDVEQIVLVYASTDCGARHTITDNQAMGVYDEEAETVDSDEYEALFYTSNVDVTCDLGTVQGDLPFPRLGRSVVRRYSRRSARRQYPRWIARRQRSPGPSDSRAYQSSSSFAIVLRRISLVPS